MLMFIMTYDLNALQFCERSKHFGDNSLYDSWASILEYSRHMDTNGRIKDPAIRLQRITSISEQHGGENDRFYMGLFTNYLNGTSASLLANVSHLTLLYSPSRNSSKYSAFSSVQ